MQTHPCQLYEQRLCGKPRWALKPRREDWNNSWSMKPRACSHILSNPQLSIRLPLPPSSCIPPLSDTLPVSPTKLQKQPTTISNSSDNPPPHPQRLRKTCSAWLHTNSEVLLEIMRKPKLTGVRFVTEKLESNSDRWKCTTVSKKSSRTISEKSNFTSFTQDFNKVKRVNILGNGNNRCTHYQTTCFLTRISQMLVYNENSHF